MKRLLYFTSLILLLTASAFADIARPEPVKTPKQVKGIDTTMMIRLDRDAKEAKLVIPKSQIRQLRAQLEQIDVDSDNTAALTSPTNFSRTQTIVSGAFLSLAIVFGGMWFVRSGKAETKTGKTVVVLAMLAGIGSAATFVYANAGPPPETRSITSKIFSQSVRSYNFGSGKIRIETKEDSNSVELIVPDPADKPKTDE